MQCVQTNLCSVCTNRNWGGGHSFSEGTCSVEHTGSKVYARRFRSGLGWRKCVVLFTPPRARSTSVAGARRDRSWSDSSAGPAGMGSADWSVFIDQRPSAVKWGLRKLKLRTSVNTWPARKTLPAPAGRPAPRWCKCALKSIFSPARLKKWGLQSFFPSALKGSIHHPTWWVPPFLDLCYKPPFHFFSAFVSFKFKKCMNKPKSSWRTPISRVQPPILTISSNLAIVAKLGDSKCL